MDLYHLQSEITSRYPHFSVAYEESPFGESITVQQGKSIIANLNHQYNSNDYILTYQGKVDTCPSEGEARSQLMSVLDKGKKRGLFGMLTGR